MQRRQEMIAKRRLKLGRLVIRGPSKRAADEEFSWTVGLRIYRHRSADTTHPATPRHKTLISQLNHSMGLKLAL
ncbi:hypothetical protein ACOMHN_059095 [Nucella lapillus]